jgi:hypothetical protein
VIRVPEGLNGWNRGLVLGHARAERISIEGDGADRMTGVELGDDAELRSAGVTLAGDAVGVAMNGSDARLGGAEIAARVGVF